MHPKRYRRTRMMNGRRVFIALSPPAQASAIVVAPPAVDSVDKRLYTVRKLCAATGASRSFIYRLLKDGALRRYKIYDTLYVSMTEFETLALMGGQQTIR